MQNFKDVLSQPLASKLNVLRSKIAANLKQIHISRGQEKIFSTLGPKLRESKAQQDNGDKQRQIRIEVIDYYLKDKTPVIVGFHTNKNGKNKSVVKVNVWRSKQSVYYEAMSTKMFQSMFYKPITSESAPVDMEDAKSGHPGPFTLSATGRAAEKWPWFLGDYNLTEEEHSGRPVYRNATSTPQTGAKR